MRKRFAGVLSQRAKKITPENNNGNVISYKPQDLYQKAKVSELHRYGRGKFCRFRIHVDGGLSVVYVVTVGNKAKYVGECQDLLSRSNSGYGNISPRNCFVGGKLTNCRINKAILSMVLSGRSAHLWFHRAKRDERKLLEKRLISRLNPEWNHNGNEDVATRSHYK